MCSPGLACDPSSVCTRASTARLTAAVQGLQGPGSRPVPLRVAHDPDRPTAVLRPTLRCEATLTWRCELRAAPSTWLRRARAFVCLACASRGWPGSIPKASSDLRSGQGVWILMAVLGLRRGARSDELRRFELKHLFAVPLAVVPSVQPPFRGLGPGYLFCFRK
jgi:hypothetical protein